MIRHSDMAAKLVASCARLLKMRRSRSKEKAMGALFDEIRKESPYLSPQPPRLTAHDPFGDAEAWVEEVLLVNPAFAIEIKTELKKRLNS